jgi:hypothetical protein
MRGIAAIMSLLAVCSPYIAVCSPFLIRDTSAIDAWCGYKSHSSSDSCKVFNAYYTIDGWWSIKSVCQVPEFNVPSNTICGGTTNMVSTPLMDRINGTSYGQIYVYKDYYDFMYVTVALDGLVSNQCSQQQFIDSKIPNVFNISIWDTHLSSVDINNYVNLTYVNQGLYDGIYTCFTIRLYLPAVCNPETSYQSFDMYQNDCKCKPGITYCPPKDISTSSNIYIKVNVNLSIYNNYVGESACDDKDRSVFTGAYAQNASGLIIQTNTLNTRCSLLQPPSPPPAPSPPPTPPEPPDLPPLCLLQLTMSRRAITSTNLQQYECDTFASLATSYYILYPIFQYTSYQYDQYTGYPTYFSSFICTFLDSSKMQITSSSYDADDAISLNKVFIKKPQIVQLFISDFSLGCGDSFVLTDTCNNIESKYDSSNVPEMSCIPLPPTTYPHQPPLLQPTTYPHQPPPLQPTTYPHQPPPLRPQPQKKPPSTFVTITVFNKSDQITCLIISKAVRSLFNATKVRINPVSFDCMIGDNFISVQVKSTRTLVATRSTALNSIINGISYFVKTTNVPCGSRIVVASTTTNITWFACHKSELNNIVISKSVRELCCR